MLHGKDMTRARFIRKYISGISKNCIQIFAFPHPHLLMRKITRNGEQRIRSLRTDIGSEFKSEL
jgi:hypothetical protein